MELVDFYRTLLPASGNYCLWYKGTKQHVWFDNLEALTAGTVRTHAKADWYFGTAAFDGAKKRKQDNVTAKRCFYLDLDAGPEKYAKHPGEVYPTQRDALGAVVWFSKAISLPPTMVVSSGHGLHVYYALSHDVTEDEWAPVAAALGRTAKRIGLLADAACTTDSARVLRPVGALHGGGARVALLKNTGRLYTLDEFRAKLGDEPEEQFALAAPKRAKMDVNAELPMFEPTPTSALKIAEKCPALRHVAIAQGDVQEPLWRAMIGLVKHTVEGADIAHEWSRGYDGYDPAETQAKYDRYEAGPTTCETFGRHTGACATCEHKGKLTSPIQLGRMSVEAVAALPEDKQPTAPAAQPVTGAPFDTSFIGEGFRVAPKEGGYVLEALHTKKEKDENGETIETKRWVRICNTVFWFDEWCAAGRDDSEPALANVCWYDNPGKMVKSASMSAGSLSSQSNLLDITYKLGIASADTDLLTKNLFYRYANSQFNMVRSMKPRITLRSRFGIQFESDASDAKLVAAHGRYVIYPDGAIEEAVLGKNLVPHRHLMNIAPLAASVEGKWGPEVWPRIKAGAQAHVEFLRKYYTREGYEVAQLATMLGLASPLMVFAADTTLTPGLDLPNVGACVSLYSRSSGQGKTSMQRVIASAFGDPSALVRSGSRQDSTRVAVALFTSMLGTAPLMLDEVTQNGPAEVADLVNMIASGTDKNRGGSTNGSGVTLRQTHTWALIGTVSSNVPQRELLAAAQKRSDALQMRILELNCEFPAVTNGVHVEFENDRDTLIAPNYGCLGAILHLAIVRSGYRAMRERVQAAFGEAAQVIEGSTQRERFYQRAMACVLVCHDILAAAGLAPFDRDLLKTLYKNAVREAIEYVETNAKSPEDLARKMISDLAPHIIVTYGQGTGRLEPVRNSHHLKPPYAGRRIEGDGLVYLMVDAVRNWANENQVSYTEVVKHAREKGYAVPVLGGEPGVARRMTITKGTDLGLTAGPCFGFNEALLFGADAVKVPDNLLQMVERKTNRQ